MYRRSHEGVVRLHANERTIFWWKVKPVLWTRMFCGGKSQVEYGRNCDGFVREFSSVISLLGKCSHVPFVYKPSMWADILYGKLAMHRWISMKGQRSRLVRLSWLTSDYTWFNHSLNVWLNQNVDTTASKHSISELKCSLIRHRCGRPWHAGSWRACAPCHHPHPWQVPPSQSASAQCATV